MGYEFVISIAEKVSCLRIYVIAGMSKNELIGEFGDPIRLKMKINAIAEDGKANKEIINFLAKSLKITKSEIEFIRGETSRNKDLKIYLSKEELNLRISKML